MDHTSAEQVGMQKITSAIMSREEKTSCTLWPIVCTADWVFPGNHLQGP